jgi:hypothetical protein
MIEEKLSRKDWKITKKSVRATAWCTEHFPFTPFYNDF